MRELNTEQKKLLLAAQAEKLVYLNECRKDYLKHKCQIEDNLLRIHWMIEQELCETKEETAELDQKWLLKMQQLKAQTDKALNSVEADYVTELSKLYHQ